METDMVDYFMAYSLSKFDGWALTGAWAAIGKNTVHADWTVVLLMEGNAANAWRIVEEVGQGLCGNL